MWSSLCIKNKSVPLSYMENKEFYSSFHLKNKKTCLSLVIKSDTASNLKINVWDFVLWIQLY